jgi:hypothetical protein
VRLSEDGDEYFGGGSHELLLKDESDMVGEHDYETGKLKFEIL